MKAIVLFLLLCSASPFLNAQIYTPKDVQLPEDFENVYKEEIFTDDLVSSFFIAIRKNVPLHKHVNHSEHVYVLEGTGEMRLGDEHISIAPGDVIIIPKDTPHSLEVTSMDPVRIISIQAPKYDGSDKVKLD